MLEFKAFTKEDWGGLAGAEEFPDGTPPMLAEFKAAFGQPGYAVLDATGLTVELQHEYTTTLSAEVGYPMAGALAVSLTEYMTRAEMAEAFEKAGGQVENCEPPNVEAGP